MARTREYFAGGHGAFKIVLVSQALVRALEADEAHVRFNEPSSAAAKLA